MWNFKKKLSLLTALALTISSALPVNAQGSPAQQLRQSKKSVKFEQQIGFERMDPKQEVRVIVILDGDTAVDKAIEQGVSISELSDMLVASAAEGARRQQSQVKNEIEAADISIQYHNSYDTIINGFSATVTAEDAIKLSKLPGILAVRKSRLYRRPKPVPAMSTSRSMIGADILQGEGYSGKGTVVAVIDTGFNADHEDLTLEDSSQMKLDRAEVSAAGLPGVFKSKKVPYAYDYADEDVDTVEVNPNSHGMHVAGTVAANGSEADGGVRGVAPNAQILAMKVFPDAEATAADDVIIRAIDDAVKLGADAMNLSLGSDAGMTLEDAFDPERLAVDRAVKAGIVMVIAAGNANHYGSSSILPRTTDMDYGVVGSPAAYESSFAVASVNNTSINGLEAMTVTAGQTSFKVAFQSSGALPVTTNTPMSIEFCNLGRTEDVEGKDLSGKMALIERGAITFAEKVANAHSKGAAGVVIFNHEAGGDQFVGMAGLEDAQIPAVSVWRSDGLKIKALNDAQVNFISGDKVDVVNPFGGQMSDFTSWGVTADLKFKPEIAAPGGSIRSLDTQGHQQMSGTSMATPHVAGAVALFTEAQRDRLLKNKEQEERVLLIKNVFMSTAVPIRSTNGVFESPRRQGAGMLNLAAAMNTPCYLVNVQSKQAKVELKDRLSSGQFSFEIVNFSDEESVTYKISSEAMTDSVEGDKVNPNMPRSITSMLNLSHPSSVTVMPGSRETVTVHYDTAGLSELESIFPSGFFIDGFIQLEDENVVEPKPTLSIPFMGFKGDWNAPKILDYSNYEVAEGTGVPYYDFMTGLYTTVGYNDEENKYQDLGSNVNSTDFDKERIAISPDGNGDGDEAFFAATFLRNAREMIIEIKDKDGNLVAVPYTLSKADFVLKNFFDGDESNPMLNAEEEWKWDGKDQFGKTVPDGQYVYIVKTRVHYPNVGFQIMHLPVKVDTVKPIIHSVKEEYGKATVLAEDEFSGIREYRLVFEDGTLLSNETGEFDLPAEKMNEKRTYLVIDHAHNIAEMVKEPSNSESEKVDPEREIVEKPPVKNLLP